MDKRFIIDETIKNIIEGKTKKYKGYIVPKHDFNRYEYEIKSLFIYIIARRTFINSYPNLDYVCINISDNLQEVIDINTEEINNTVYYIFIPIKKEDDHLVIINDIKDEHPKHGFNEEPFYNSL